MVVCDVGGAQSAESMEVSKHVYPAGMAPVCKMCSLESPNTRALQSANTRAPLG